MDKNMPANEQYFWDKNPCGGEWSSFKEKVAWAIETEPYALELLLTDRIANKVILEAGAGKDFCFLA
jgi:hypothetical protein